jgi:hypothetical protein
VLDAAPLSLSSLELEREPRAHLTIRGGFLALRRISDVAGIQHDPDPAPGDPIAPWTSDRGPVGGIDRRRSQRRVRRTRRQSHADTRAGTRLRRR